MATSPAFSIISSIFLLSFLISSTTVYAGDHQLGWIPSRPTCRGSIAECQPQEEFAMDSEINRRMLDTSDYISYEALKRDSVPCSQAGASYYNCQAGAQANPYNRGCSTITQCRG
ncbi:Rapid ALkalinization Factor [Cinnamomum micranthum f. kanehirae]|uniref:Rapid ALkalinization Factor n=1 Tax=Cinnamomum micranthum f. kanehirae TaxID=337451 RepID=A0A3S3N3M8_9MAGN|nr:Rapid ALkalinization Factor [Cinnamomum micranthum f. kanehirae]